MLVLCCAVLCVVWSRSSFWSWLVAVAEGEGVVEVEVEVEVFVLRLFIISRRLFSRQLQLLLLLVLLVLLVLLLYNYYTTTIHTRTHAYRIRLLHCGASCGAILCPLALQPSCSRTVGVHSHQQDEWQYQWQGQYHCPSHQRTPAITQRAFKTLSTGPLRQMDEAQSTHCRLR
jgi:hypothetical protein